MYVGVVSSKCNPSNNRLYNFEKLLRRKRPLNSLPSDGLYARNSHLRNGHVFQVKQEYSKNVKTNHGPTLLRQIVTCEDLSLSILNSKIVHLILSLIIYHFISSAAILKDTSYQSNWRFHVLLHTHVNDKKGDH